MAAALGRMNIPAVNGPGHVGKPSAIQPAVQNSIVNAALGSMVRFSKQALQLPAKVDGTDTVVITNGSQSDVSLDYECSKESGVDCVLDRPNLSKNGSATLTVKHAAAQKQVKPSASVKVTIKPFGRVVMLPVTQH